MRERPHDGPLPKAYPAPGARPPHPDGDSVPVPVRPPLARRQYAYGVTIALLVLVLLVVGIIR